MSGCGFPGGCAKSAANGGAGCYLCDVIANLPQPVIREHIRPQDAGTRDGVQDFSLKSHDPTFTKRHRVGPHR